MMDAEFNCFISYEYMNIGVAEIFSKPPDRIGYAFY